MKKKIGIVSLVTVLLLVIYCVTTYKLMNSRTYQVFGEIVPRVETTQKVVALTFDDGPTEYTDELLKELDDAGVKATFFLIGNEIEKHPDEAKKLVQAGHEVGNHTYSHNRMVFKSPSYISTEIEKTDALLRDAGVQGEILFRPPNGKKLLYLPYYLSQHERKTIMWDVEPDSFDDIASRADKIVDYTVQHVQPGSIILLHAMYDSRQESRKAVPGIISALKAQGYEFKTVSELQNISTKP
ncbi:polysaccharide deacetylase family protein [Tumebacillus sp. ITR2]|uniref:Polysaccharide deacetylase family protein n=1 Tax=Tumebacillus amylolyticus TaxID=2801339 RepID=A0ABS1JDV0_9BACL|nr:polysaccharide deacetylase family protein [Tumebacillus amylolyticus]MBL0387778.1 polysaccharide deacetylase family protein [Tumebacillus amylolyticus]